MLQNLSDLEIDEDGNVFNPHDLHNDDYEEIKLDEQHNNTLGGG